jgi:hypothetical protein
MRMKGHYAVFLYCFFLLTSCGRDEILLENVSVPQEASVIKLDSNTTYSLSIYNISVGRALGKMDSYLLVTKDTLFPKSGFRIADGKGGVRISDFYLAIVGAFGEKNWGWFHVKDGKISNTLPYVDRLADSLRIVYGEGFFIRHTNGTIDVLKNGRKIKSYDYGDLLYDSVIAKNSTMLPGVYQLKNKTLVLLSKNPDELFTQKDGEYYVPSPGYRVIKKVRKGLLYRTIDSVLRLSPIPSAIAIAAE